MVWQFNNCLINCINKGENMSFILRKGVPLDREAESQYLIEKINLKSSNIVFIVWSDSGIGKTSLIKKIKYVNKLSSKIISITTPPVNKNTLVLSGQYISYLATSLNEAYKNSIFSMNAYLSMEQDLRTNHKNSKELLDNLPAIPHKIFSINIDKILSTGNYDENYILNSTDTDSILINVSYVKYVLENNDIVLNIQNIQNIDTISLLELKNIIGTLPIRGYIFEYTTISENITDLMRLADVFNEVSEVEIMKLDNLPIQIIQSILPKNLGVTIEELNTYYKKIAKGNLYQLQNFVNNKESGINTDICNDSTKLKIENLTSNSQLILQIIEFHDGIIEKALFFDILSNIQKDIYIMFSQCLTELKSIIRDEKDFFSIEHASIIESSQNINNRQIVMIAANFLQEYYEHILNTENYLLMSKKQALLYLFKVYSINDPIMILKYIDDFRFILVASIDKAQAYNLILQVFNSLPINTGKEIKFKLINIAYEIGLYEESLLLLEETGYIDISFSLCKCMILNRLDRHNEALDLCEMLLQYSCRINSREEFIVKLIQMLSLRSLNRTKKYLALSEELLKNTEYRKYLEYGFFLRNMQISVTYKESLKFVKNSINLFKDKNEKEYMLYSILTLCVQLARLGYVDNSMKLLSTIEDSVLNLTLEKHVIYNNKAAIEMLSKEKDISIIAELKKAYITAVTSFDKIVILNNQICFMIIQNVDENFSSISNETIKLLENEPDVRLHRRTYINIALFYKYVLKNQTLYMSNINKAKEFELKGDLIGDHFINNSEPPQEVYFIANQKCYISFITYWHFPIPMI